MRERCENLSILPILEIALQESGLKCGRRSGARREKEEDGFTARRGGLKLGDVKMRWAAGWALAMALGFAAGAAGQVLDLDGRTVDPFAGRRGVVVLVFARTDCPLTNRYAPELRRLMTEFEARGVRLWMVYPDPAETAAAIREERSRYQMPGEALRDPKHELVKRAKATVAPEAAVFDGAGRLVYHGRIDDQWVDFGVSRRAAQTHDLEDAIRAALDGKPVARAETRAVGCSLADVE